MKQAVAKAVSHLQWFLIAIILFFSTAAFGGIDPLGLYITRLLIVFSFVLQLILFLIKERPAQDFNSAVFFPSALFTAFLFLVYVQSFFGLRLLSGSPIGSVDPYATNQFLMQLVIYFMFFMVCLGVLGERRFAQRLASLIVVLVFIIVILGLFQKLMTDENVLWKRLSSAGGSFGPFINENHFGGFLGLTFPLALALMHYRFNRVAREFKNQKGALLRNWSALLNEGVIFLFFLVILTLVACLFSTARVSGVVLFFCCIAYFVAYAMKERNIKFYFVLLLILVASFFLIQGIAKNIFATYYNSKLISEAWDMRLLVARQSLTLFRDYPFFGTGLGTYGLISSKAVTCLINEVWWNHVHNDFIELLTDTGLTGFCLFLGAILILIFISLRQIKKIPSHWNQTIAIQACISIFCIAAMELSDFHLRIPSVALLFILQLAFLFQAAHSKETAAPQFSSAEKSSPRFNGIWKAAVFTFGLALCVLVVSFSISDYRLFQPSNAKFWHSTGKEYQEKAMQLSKEDPNRIQLLNKAIVSFRKATSLSPARSQVWFELGSLEYWLGHQKEGIFSLEQAVYWNPAFLQYSLYLLRIYLTEMEKAPTLVEKIEFLNQAKALYQRLQHLERTPREGEYETWMGEHYHKKLGRLMPSWS